MTNELFELWMPVKGYKGLYEVSDLGRIKRLERYVINEYGNEEILEERILNQYNGEYKTVSLYRDGKQDWISVHRIVAQAFIDNPHGKPCVNHRDLDKWNNDVRNLEWVTHKENTLHWMQARSSKIIAS
ncbi:NUMOD4 motif-containing HNH endonuclease [Bacillus sp. CCB-MMP212]|uniref:NUMOD4 domain-containing protein n=1 Tax=Bacillus sp. CCB-MMP212 TaxID=2928002 RepID=UPI001F62290F|nr:NUMOD4 domain-containing protein [Bacillus sp. CCB-MMP212]MCI4247655.1 NUMOD4 motif-containing HNH endonuclease [Bacillus sp. CCB-MMP212]